MDLRTLSLMSMVGDYFGGWGMAEEWWSTMSQLSPFFT
jgi:hypothetical protein